MHVQWEDPDLNPARMLLWVLAHSSHCTFFPVTSIFSDQLSDSNFQSFCSHILFPLCSGPSETSGWFFALFPILGATPCVRMSAPTQQPVSLEHLSEIVWGQATALGKHEQALAALFAELQRMSENIANIQTLPQPQPTPSTELPRLPVSELDQATHAETRLRAPPTICRGGWRMQSLHYAVLAYVWNAAFPVPNREI